MSIQGKKVVSLDTTKLAPTVQVMYLVFEWTVYSFMLVLWFAICSHTKCKIQDPGRSDRWWTDSQGRRSDYSHSQTSGLLSFPYGELPSDDFIMTEKFDERVASVCCLWGNWFIFIVCFSGHASFDGALFLRGGPGPRWLCLLGIHRACTAKVRSISLLYV